MKAVTCNVSFNKLKIEGFAKRESFRRLCRLLLNLGVLNSVTLVDTEDSMLTVTWYPRLKGRYERDN